MTRLVRWFALLVGTCILAGGMIWLLKPLVLFVLVLLWPDIVDTKNPAYLAETTVDGYTFEVILFRNHPLVAEYRKLGCVDEFG